MFWTLIDWIEWVTGRYKCVYCMHYRHLITFGTIDKYRYMKCAKYFIIFHLSMNMYWVFFFFWLYQDVRRILEHEMQYCIRIYILLRTKINGAHVPNRQLVSDCLIWMMKCMWWRTLYSKLTFQMKLKLSEWIQLLYWLII